jgi:hypothetical protein
MAKAIRANEVQMFDDFICSCWLMRQFGLLSSYHCLMRNCNAIDCGPMQCGRNRILPPNRPDAPARSAGFQTCCIADFPVGKALEITQFAGLETRDTADLEVCATGVVSSCA